jgi:hypothetical protein
MVFAECPGNFLWQCESRAGGLDGVWPEQCELDVMSRRVAFEHGVPESGFEVPQFGSDDLGGGVEALGCGTGEQSVESWPELVLCKNGGDQRHQEEVGEQPEEGLEREGEFEAHQTRALGSTSM